MKQYKITIANVDLSPLHKYVLALDFSGAVEKAFKILKQYQKEIAEAEIEAVECECEITEV